MKFRHCYPVLENIESTLVKKHLELPLLLSVDNEGR